MQVGPMLDCEGGLQASRFAAFQRVAGLAKC